MLVVSQCCLSLVCLQPHLMLPSAVQLLERVSSHYQTSTLQGGE